MNESDMSTGFGEVYTRKTDPFLMRALVKFELIEGNTVIITNIILTDRRAGKAWIIDLIF